MSERNKKKSKNGWGGGPLWDRLLLLLYFSALILFSCLSSGVLLCFHFTSTVVKPAKASCSNTRQFNLRWLWMPCRNQKTNTYSLSWRMNKVFSYQECIFVWVCAGEPVRGGASAEAEGGVVRSDPWPQPACWSRLRITARPQEAASPAGEPGQRESARNHDAHRQNTATATGAYYVHTYTHIQ